MAWGEAIASGVSYLWNPLWLLPFLAAVTVAALTGVIPGFSGGTLTIIAIPFIVLNIDDPLIGITILVALTGCDNTLDSIPAVLMGRPEAATQVTFLEGHQLAQRGQAAYTLGAIYSVSALGGVIGAIALMVTIPVIKPFILSFGFPEIAAMGIFGVAMVGALSGGALLKGLTAGLLGLLLSTVGIHGITGIERFTLGQLQLWSGLPLVVLGLGLFALPELVDLTSLRAPIAKSSAGISTREVFRGAGYGLRRWPMVVRQSIYGAFLGAIPGVGAAVVDWLAYAFGIIWAKDKSQFGKGSLEGVLFAESAQNSKEGGQAIPTLAFGIPGGRGWIWVLAVMIMYGISPGPQMLSLNTDLVIVVVMTLALANLLVTCWGVIATGQLAKLTLIPFPLIASVIFPITFLAAFNSTGHVSAIWMLLLFCAVGLLMKQFKWPRPPLILGFVLGSIIEGNLQSALSIHGAVGILTRPLTIVLLLAAVAVAVFFAKVMSREGAVPTTGGPQVTEVAAGDERPHASGSPRLAVQAGGAAASQWNDEPQRSRPHVRFVFPSVFTLLVVVFAIAVWVAALEYSPRARFFPVLLCVGILVFAGIQFIREIWGVQTGRIMDIGMRSAGQAGAFATYMLLLGSLAVYLLLMGTIGMKFATLALSVLLPVLLLSGRSRWIGVAVSLGVTSVFVFVLMETITGVIWPRPFLLDLFS